jgi:TonB-dependent receptor
MKTIKLFFALAVFLSIFSLHADDNKDGKITGKVYDASNGSTLPEAVVKLENLNKGTASDLDGKFELKDIQAGKYNLEVSCVGYIQKNVKIEIKPSEVLNVDIVLEPESMSIDTLTVEAIRLNNNEAGLLLKQQKSESILDGISEQQIKRAPDASASDVLKRIIGVSIVKDKYVFVRGTTDRYNNTTLNGVLVPSTEPDKKAFSFDLFPSNLLDNIVISKTFTPDQPGNYSGGLVQITTKEFPERFTLNYNVSSSFTSGSTGKDFYSYGGLEKKLWFLDLGIDNGSRKMPSMLSADRLISSNYTREENRDISRAFNTNWGQSKTSAPLSSGFQLSAGNVFNLGKIPIGVLGSYSYRNGFSNKEIENNTYNTDYTQLSGYKGRSSEYSVLWGGFLNLNAKLNDFNKIGLKSTYTLSAEDETEYYEGFYTPEAQERKLYMEHFTQRNLLSAQLFGEHYFERIGKLSVNWKGSYSESRRQEPDFKTLAYQREQFTTDPFYASINYNQPSANGGDRFFSDLKDITRSFALDLELPFKFKLPFSKKEISNSKMKFGGSLNGTKRNFEARSFGPALYLGAPFAILYQSIDSIFNSVNFDVNRMFLVETTKEDDKYRALENTYSGYMMFDIPVKKLRAVFGARYEYNEQGVSTFGIVGTPINTYLKKIDVLPSVNLTYQISEKMNLRGAYTQTVSRPEIREIAPFSYTDFVTGILVFGNSNLHRSLVRNFDLRYEFFPQPGEIASVSLFYKKFDSPIEDVFLPTSTNKLKTFQNAENGADNYGLEIELRKNLGFITKYLKDLSINGNVSIVNSKVNLKGSGSTATKTERRMQGQSPYTVNLGLFYDNYNLGTSVNLTFNRFGDRISEVGLNGYEDIIERGRSLLDFSASQKLFKNFEIKFSVKDILNQDQEYTQKVNNEDKTIKKINSGRGYSISLSYKY